MLVVTVRHPRDVPASAPLSSATVAQNVVARPLRAVSGTVTSKPRLSPAPATARPTSGRDVFAVAVATTLPVVWFVIVTVQLAALSASKAHPVKRIPDRLEVAPSKDPAGAVSVMLRLPSCVVPTKTLTVCDPAGTGMATE